MRCFIEGGANFNRIDKRFNVFNLPVTDSPGARTKKWLILRASLTYLVESRDLFF